MSDVRSLAFQIGCLRDTIPAARNEDIRSGLEQALQTLEWIERREDLIKMLEKLRTDNPSLYDTFVFLSRAFPGASIEDIRALEAEELGL